jgi:uncharacterized protein YdaU (DUF1376 family)
MHESGMAHDSAPVKSKKRKSHQTDPWYKRYPRDYYEDTRELKLDERGAYSDILDLIYMAEGPIPDDLRSIAFKLHCDLRQWKRIRGRLLALGKLFLVGGKLHNKRARDLLKTRAEERAAMGRNKAELGDSSGVANADLFENVIDFNASRRARSTESDHQSKKIEKQEDRERRGLQVPDAAFVIDDDPHGRRRELSPKAVDLLRERVGDSQAEHILGVYFRSRYARDAGVVDKAFPKWLERVYGENISEGMTRKELAAEIMALLPRGPDGKPDSRLPDMSRRGGR